MKVLLNTFLVIMLLILAGCGGGNKQSTDDGFIKVDVTANYPEKELILQDFMDVEYIALETTDEFLNQGFVRAIGKDVILVTNRINDGDIFVYDINGQGLRKINRKGQGGEEYSQISEIVLDENNIEMFVRDNSARKILVYDLFGNFKRSFKFADTGYYTDVYNYDQEHLICYKMYYSTESEQPGHLIISKQDGSITRKIKIPYKELKNTIVRKAENDMVLTATVPFYQIIPYHGDFVLAEASSDTVYTCFSDGTISPFIVRTPSIYSMEPEVFLCPSVLTDRYYFMQTVKKEIESVTSSMNVVIPNTDLVYDRQENAIFKYTVYNDDFSSKRRVGMSSPAVNHEIAAQRSLEAYQLVEAYEKGELKGKLKEIAAALDEESNPVIMLIKYKK